MKDNRTSQVKKEIYSARKKEKGERGIRTLDSYRNYTGFQDRSYQPLSHLSQGQSLFYPYE